MKELILYDLDGTLVDTRRDITLSVNHMLAELGKPALAQAEIEGYVGRGLHNLIKKSLKTDDLKLIEKGSKIYRDYYGKHMLDHTALYPHARETLDYFKSRKQAVVTNKPNPFSQDILTALGVAAYFMEIVAGNSGYPIKPDPVAILSMMKKENIPAGAALFVGDSLIDIETARRAGIEIAVITHGFMAADGLKSAAPEFIVADFPEFLDTARKKGW
jgi:phosphoglycolate phosphatase